jgi:hypothetical protein
MTDLVSRRSRGKFRDLATESTLGEIDRAFQDEGLAPNFDSTYQDSSSRRSLAQQYLENVDWSRPDQVARALRAMERVLEGWEGDHVEKFWRLLAHDGYKRNPETGFLEIPVTTFSPGSLSNLTDATVIKGT